MELKKVDLLSDDDSDVSQRKEDLRINKAFASQYERKKRRDDLAKAKDLLEEEDDESTSESEDEDAELLSADLDLQIINTINSIKRKDPKIYDPKSKWFDRNEGEEDDEDDDDEEVGEKGKQSKRKTFKDLAREELLRGDGDSDDDLPARSHKKGFAYDHEQEQYRKAFLAAAKRDESEGEEETRADMLQVKKRTPVEQAAEEERLQQALQDMKALYQQENPTDKEHIDFLTNYLSSKMWRKKGLITVSEGVEEDEEEDEERMEEADLFEYKYNFRFEELEENKEKHALDKEENGASDLYKQVSFDLSQGVQVVGHSRTVSDSLRRGEEKRKLQREQRKERKEKEKRQKEAELRRLKNIKRQELQERLRRIGELGGLEELEYIDESMLEEDWDPEKHEEMMRKQFGDDYYEQEEAGFDIDEEKGDAVALELGEGEDEAEGGEAEYGEEYDEDGEYNAEEYDNGEVNLEEEKEKVKSLTKELYSLDYEDIIAGMPCRFKYKQVEPEDYGLSTEEILLAEDNELNRYLSLKKLAAYEQKKVDREKLQKKRKRLRQTLEEKLKEMRSEEGQVREKLKKEEVGVKRNESKEVDGGEEKKKRRRNRKKRDGQNEVQADEGGEEMDNVVGNASHFVEEPVRKEETSSGAKGAVKVMKKDKSGKEQSKKKQQKKKGKAESQDPVKKRLALYN